MRTGESSGRQQNRECRDRKSYLFCQNPEEQENIPVIGNEFESVGQN